MPIARRQNPIYSNDDFIAGRILWRAKKNGLPNQETYEFAGAPDGVRSSFDEICCDHNFGLPVLVFGNAPEQWTVIGTRAVISYYNQTIQHCALSQIIGFNSALPDVPKQETEYLDVKLEDSSHIRLWGPRGSQFYALWNILLALSRQNLPGNSM